MKIWHFIKLQWNKFELYAKFFLINALLMILTVIIALLGYKKAALELYDITEAMAIVIVLYFIVWDGIKFSYAQYQKDQERLISTIKESHNK